VGLVPAFVARMGNGLGEILLERETLGFETVLATTSGPDRVSSTE
jgi:hypothetical protein